MSERRLAAILAADVVGYSALMGADEEGTLAAWTARQAEIIRPAIAAHGGRIFKTMGDGLLAEFASVVEAARAAAEIQVRAAEANRPLASKKRLDLRIGINLGDVIVEGDDLFGDGVNVAARLQTLAPVGGLAVSGAVHDHVRDRLDLAFDDLGEQTVKNIARPIRVFAWRVPGGNGAAGATAPAPSHAASDKPSVAVLPFANLGGDANDDYFADGMAEEIITGLSRARSLFVIARNSSFTYKGRAVDIRAVGRELAVRYVLEGSIRKSGQRLRITTQLIDAATGNHLWAEKYDGDLGDVFDLQDRITMDVVGAIVPSVLRAEVERVRRHRPENLDAYGHVLHALPHVWTTRPDGAAQALQHLEAALALDPDYMLAHALAALCHETRYSRLTRDAADRTAALTHARIVLASGSDDATALAFSAFEVALLDRDYAAALTALGRALVFNPNSAIALSFSAIVNAFAGNADAALEFAARAERQSPLDPGRWVGEIARAIAFVHGGRYGEAVRAALATLQIVPDFVAAHIFLITAYVQLGRTAEAETAARRLMAIAPNYRVSMVADVAIGPPGRTSLVQAALRAAGLPE